MDYRQSENRKEAFVEWFGQTLEIEDCDPALYMTNYFFDRFEYNTEQKLWITWIYGTTYHWPTAYVVWNEFPDMELVGVDRLTDWNNDNYRRLRYQTDTKWNKGHLPSQFISYKEHVGEQTQRSALTENFEGDPIKDFYTLWNTVNKWHKFGRYSSWFYIQALKQCCDIPIDIDSLWLHDRSGSRSHRNGLCYAVGMDEWIDAKLDEKQIEYLEFEGRELLAETRHRYPHVAEKADFFAMETSLCAFKKLFRKRDGRYLGYYLDRQAEEIRKVENDGWFGIDWKPLWDAREETLPNEFLTNVINKSRMELFLDTGDFDPRNQSIGLEAFYGIN
jgi:hypothetical protein